MPKQVAEMEGQLAGPMTDEQSDANLYGAFMALRITVESHATPQPWQFVAPAVSPQEEK